MEQSDYVRSQEYEDYIELARNTIRDKHGANNTFMLNLMRLEQDGYIVDEKKHFRAIKEIKNYMSSATEYAVSKNVLINDGDRNTLKSLLHRIKDAQIADELLEVCKEGIDLLLKYKI